MEVVIPASVPASPEAEAIPLSILYEDEHLVVVDKPAGMVVHPSPGHPSKTLVNALLAHCHDLSGIGGVERPGIVHRLDSGTTGVLVVAKHDHAHQHLATQFQERRVRKRYLAVVHGALPEHLVIDRAIGRDRLHRTKMSTRTNHPRSATSTVERLEQLPHSALLAIQIHTGRTPSNTRTLERSRLSDRRRPRLRGATKTSIWTRRTRLQMAERVPPPGPSRRVPDTNPPQNRRRDALDRPNPQ